MISHKCFNTFNTFNTMSNLLFPEFLKMRIPFYSSQNNGKCIPICLKFDW